MIWYIACYLAGILTVLVVAAVFDFCKERNMYYTRYQDDDGNPMGGA